MAAILRSTRLLSEDLLLNNDGGYTTETHIDTDMHKKMIKMNTEMPSTTAQIKRVVNHAGHKLRATLSVLLLSATSVIALCGTAHAQSLDLADNYPTRYTVVDGDTLWGIASRFLSDPWRWPEVWQGNLQVQNPDLIYPGDVLVLTFIDGQPVLKALRRETVKLKPQPRVTKFSDAIPPIDPAAIEAYINSPLVTDGEELNQAGYIVEGMGRRLVSGKYDQVYARGVSEDAESFRVFRPGRKFVHPATDEVLGYEALHVGDADMLRRGDDISRLVLTKTHTDASVRDRLRPIVKKQSLPFFQPKTPDNDDVRGTILMSENEATEVGAMSVVAVSFGQREGVKPGDVFRIWSQAMSRKDPIDGSSYVIPEEKIGLALVFRTFEKVSYALITDSSQQVTPGDALLSPNRDDKD